MSLDNLSSTVLAGTKRSLLCSVNQPSAATNNIFLRFIPHIYSFSDLKVQGYYSTGITNNSQVIVRNILNDIARLDFNSIRTSDGGQYGYRVQITNRGNFVYLYGLTTINVTGKQKCVK